MKSPVFLDIDMEAPPKAVHWELRQSCTGSCFGSSQCREERGRVSLEAAYYTFVEDGKLQFSIWIWEIGKKEFGWIHSEEKVTLFSSGMKIIHINPNSGLNWYEQFYPTKTSFVFTIKKEKK